MIIIPVPVPGDIPSSPTADAFVPISVGVRTAVGSIPVNTAVPSR